VQAATLTGEYYDQKFTRTVNHFLDTVAHWESTNANKDYAIFPNITVAYRPKPTLLQQPEPKLRLQATQLIDDDVKWKQIIKDFFTTTDDTAIPVVGHSFWHYIQYPLRPCDSFRMNYEACDKPKYAVGDAVLLTFRIMVGFWLVGWLIGMQLPIMLQVPLITTLYMIFRYDWVPRCLPMLPTCLMTDLQYLITQATPGCLCQLVPALVVNSDMCSPQFCNSDDIVIVYQDCPARDLGIAWPFMYIIRWQLPSFFLTAFTKGPLASLGSVPSVDALLQDLNEGVPTNALDNTCCVLEILDVLLLLLLVKLLFVMLGPLVQGGIRTVVSSLGSITLSLPFLLIKVPEMIQQEAQEEGLLMVGWNNI
jgi:hypothetical protein